MSAFKISSQTSQEFNHHSWHLPRNQTNGIQETTTLSRNHIEKISNPLTPHLNYTCNATLKLLFHTFSNAWYQIDTKALFSKEKRLSKETTFPGMGVGSATLARSTNSQAQKGVHYAVSIYNIGHV